MIANLAQDIREVSVRVGQAAQAPVDQTGLRAGDELAIVEASKTAILVDKVEPHPGRFASCPSP
jgi:hypothetical protein